MFYPSSLLFGDKYESTTAKQQPQMHTYKLLSINNADTTGKLKVHVLLLILVTANHWKQRCDGRLISILKVYAAYE